MANIMEEFDDNFVMEEENIDPIIADFMPVQATNNEIQSTKTMEVNAKDINFGKLKIEYRDTALCYRLLHMLEVCVNRRPEIAKAIINCVQSSGNMDVEFYRRFATELEKHKNADPSKTWPTIDKTWITSTEEKIQSMIERESAALKKAHDEGIKENIRIAMTRLFDVNFRAGKFYEAAKLYSRNLRDYCVTPQTIVPMLLDHIKVLMLSQDYLRAETYVNQAERAIVDCQQRESKSSQDNKTTLLPIHRDEKSLSAAVKQASKDMAKIHAVMGVTKMCNKNYLAAVDKFVAIDHEFFDFRDLFSQTDIAYYGCFCALATYDRNILNEKVINNGNFRKYLESEGKLVDLIQAFRSNSFTTVFQLLEELRPYLLLNIYIAPHQKQLYKLIRRQAFIQYISTFGVITLSTMGKVFRTDTNELIDELVDLIDNGIIDARIDPIEGQLYRIDENPTLKNSKRLAKIQQDLAERTHVLVIRAGLALNGVNPSKDMEAEMEASGSSPMMENGRKGGRRRGGRFGFEDYESEEDMEVATQSDWDRTMSNGRNVLSRVMNHFTSAGRPSPSSRNPPPPLAGNGSILGFGHPPVLNDRDQSDTDMADP